jgi:hypothetical protein
LPPGAGKKILATAFVKKLLLITAGVLVVLLGLYVVADFFLGSLVKAGVNRFGPGMTRTSVVLAGAHISPFTGEGTLTGLVVGNPPGWSGASAFSLGRIHLAVAPSSVFTDCIVINELEIEDPVFDYETRFVSSNLGELLSRINGRRPADEAQAATKSGPPLKFIVKRLTLTGGKVIVGVGPTAIPLPMPPIQLTDLGVSTGGVTSLELGQIIMRVVAQNVASAATHAATKFGSTFKGSVTEKVKALKDLLP